MANAGVPGFESAAIFGIFAPAGTPAAIIDRLNREIVQFLGKPDAREKFLTAGVEPVGSTPDQFAATIRSEMAKWGKLMKDVGIRAE